MQLKAESVQDILIITEIAKVDDQPFLVKWLLNSWNICICQCRSHRLFVVHLRSPCSVQFKHMMDMFCVLIA